MDLSVSIGGIILKNPLIVASADVSLDKQLFSRIMDAGPGAVVTKSVTDIPQLQSASITRFKIMDRGDINFTLLSRGGPMLTVDAWQKLLDDWTGRARKNNTRIIASLCCNTIVNWIKYAGLAEKAGADMIELNLGNPHGGASDKPAGYLLGQSLPAATEVVRAVTGSVKLPAIVKLTPQVTDLTPFASGALENGAAAVNVMHRFQGFRVNIETAEPELGGLAGVGGPWMKSISMGWISRLFNQGVRPVLGSNGIGSPDDVIEFMMSGATAVQFASALMVHGPEFINTTLAVLEDFLSRKKYSSAKEIIGLAAGKVITYKQLGTASTTRYTNRREICLACPINHRCVDYCYFDAIKIEGGEVRFQETCNGCGWCRQMCTVPEAISERIKP